MVSVQGGTGKHTRNNAKEVCRVFPSTLPWWMAGYEDVNDADRLAIDPVMRQGVGGRAVDAQAASASQMGRFETETLALSENRAALSAALKNAVVRTQHGGFAV